MHAKRAAAMALAKADQKTQRDTRTGLAALDAIASRRHVWSPVRPTEGGGASMIVDDHEEVYAELLDKDDRKAYRVDLRAAAKREAAQMADWLAVEDDEEEAFVSEDAEDEEDRV
jgi:hypothetical protein